MPLSEAKWDSFLQELKSGQCCLLLGPEIGCLGPEGGKLTSVMAEFSGFIAGLLDKQNIPYEKSQPDFYYLANKYITSRYPGEESRFEKEIQSFRELLATMQPSFFQKIARLPFNSIVNLVPDNFLSAELARIGYEFVEEYYDYTRSRTVDITEEMQLVYNLFGSYEHPDSVAVTEQQRLNLLKNLIAGAPQVQDKITKRFTDKKKSFLFLGFDFNNWHFRLVMDALKIPKPNSFSYTPQIVKEHSIGFLTGEFYYEKLRLELIDQTTEEFIEEVATRYQKRYGDFDRKIKVVLDYHDAVSTQFNEFWTAMQTSTIMKRIDPWHKGMGLAGTKQDLINDKMKEAEVYIPFFSSDYILDEHSTTRLTSALSDKAKKIIPIYTNPCNHKPLTTNKGLTVLPRNDIPLSFKNGADLSQVCLETVRIINCVVR
jgi:hypothetical protein